MYEMLYGEKPKEVPSVRFVRQCRVVVEVIGETIVALKLASADSWKQLWTDATTRRQIPFTALVIGILADDETVDPVVVSSCIFMDDERSETQADGIVSKVSLLSHEFEHRQIYSRNSFRLIPSSSACKDSLTTWLRSAQRNQTSCHLPMKSTSTNLVMMEL
jgi:hypothetical protein